jgi:hypothetical protein
MRAETMSGIWHSPALKRKSDNTIGAENYYQYAEYYFRSMSSDSERT